MRLRKQRDDEAMRRAKALHDECMKDPEYRQRWETLTKELFGLLADLPPDVLT